MKRYNQCIACKTNTEQPDYYSIRYGLKKGINDLKTMNPELASEWDYDKNELLPEDYTYNSNKKVWWKCKKCNNSWFAAINQRKVCPECKKSAITYNIYDIDFGELVGTFVGLRDVCKFLDVDYNKQKGNICSVIKRSQKTVSNKYIVRKSIDDEFKDKTKSTTKDLIDLFLNQ